MHWKRSKNDRNDAEAISEAASRPTMLTVPVKSADDQAGTIIVKYRALMVNQRTQAINALRGHAAEFGIIAAKGCANVNALLAILLAEEAVSAIAIAMFEQMGQHVADLDAKVDVLEKQLLEQHKANAVNKRLAAIPSVGPITASTMALTANPVNFETGRHFAAWIGLTSREHSTDRKHRLGKISKAGLATPALRDAQTPAYYKSTRQSFHL